MEDTWTGDCDLLLKSACVSFSDIKMSGDVADSAEARNDGSHAEHGKSRLLVLLVFFSWHLYLDSKRGLDGETSKSGMRARFVPKHRWDS